MMTQYESIKAECKDSILFFRLGDFYEMFNEDAIKVSAMLELTLTSKEYGQGKRAPMCGIPYHAADEYIKELVNRGETVAICEQLEDPSTTKGLVKRGIVRTISSGTFTEESCIDELKNNFICCIY
ncbi:MAG: DNA mismatch repair protein MutS, partial [Clostridia bacterium]|nr:DNA mismatch repair protein MutS [Clostridia bacterium]